MNQSNVHSGRTMHQIPCRAAMNSVEWNPKHNLLAYAGDDKNKYQADEGKTVMDDLKHNLFCSLYLFLFLSCFRCLPNIWL